MVIPGPSGIIPGCASPNPSPRVSQLTKHSIISAFGRQGRILSLPAVLSPHKGVEPTSEHERDTLEDVELKLAHSEAVEV
jgi:hypothetical protein